MPRSLTHVPAFWYRFCITVACRDSYACGYFTVSAFVCRSWALVVLGFRTCLVRMYIGHSSSSVSVHASFACISREMLMPRSHVSRGRRHHVYRGVDILRAVEESADSSILRSFEKTHLRCWSSVCPFSSLDSSNSNASVVTRQSFDDASDWPSRSSDRIDFQKHQITSLHVSSLLRPFTSSSQRGKVLAYPSPPELIG